jgi:hypothetical protein
VATKYTRPFFKSTAAGFFDVSFSHGAGYGLLSYKGPAVPWQAVINTQGDENLERVTINGYIAVHLCWDGGLLDHLSEFNILLDDRYICTRLFRCFIFPWSRLWFTQL